jgi:hypothetical protein
MEARELHARLLRCTLAVEESRSYWEYRDSESAPQADAAFSSYVFGAKSLARVKLLLANMRARYDAFPTGLEVLRHWRAMRPETRAPICHWHLQLADPLYRRFTGSYLVARRQALKPEVHLPTVTNWVEQQSPHRWSVATRKEFAGKLLSAARSAGLVVGRRDPRQLAYPRITDEALAYLLYLLRDLQFEGTLTDNPYFGSVGLGPAELDQRLPRLRGLRYRRVGDLIDFGWRYPSLVAWAEAEVIEKRIRA